MSSNHSLKRTAAELLAAAALEQFPNLILAGGKATPRGFCYDFIFPFAFQEAFLPLIEERMRAVIKENRPLVLREMMPENAALFFEHRAQTELAALARKSTGSLATVVEMGEFYDLGEPPYLAYSGEVGAFKLTACEELEAGVVRISGCAFSSKDELKSYLKRLKHYKEQSHLTVMQEMALFAPCGEGFWQWQPKGELLRAELMRWWREEHKKQNFRFTSTPPIFSKNALIDLHRPFGPRAAVVAFLEERGGDDTDAGLFGARGYTRDLAYLFCGRGELLRESISSLQFIAKTSKILDFEWCLALCSGAARKNDAWRRAESALRRASAECGFPLVEDAESPVECGPRLEVRIADALGCYWPGPQLEIDCRSGALVRSMLGAWERTVALLLEKSGGDLPFWLAPEQARIFAVGSGVVAAAEAQRQKLMARGLKIGIDFATEEKLAGRVHKALLEKVPYCIFIGDREKELNEVSVRARGEKSDRRVKIETLAETWNRKQEERT